MKNQITMKIIHVLSIFFIFTFHAFAQDTGPTFQNSKGTIFKVDQNTDYRVTNPLEDNSIFHLFPKNNSKAKIAHAVIRDGTEETLIYAEDIKFEIETQDFVLTGNAKIVQGENVLQAPERIEYDSEENQMIAIGTDSNPAAFSYQRKNGSFFNSKSTEFTFIFESQNGGRKLIEIKAKGNKNTQFSDRPRGDSENNPVPKLTN